MTNAQARHLVTVIAYSAEVEIGKVGELLPPVDEERLHQSFAYGGGEVEVDDDVGEIALRQSLSRAYSVIGRGREIHLHETAALASSDGVEAALPLHLLHLAVALQLVYVMRLIVDDHQVGERSEIVYLVATERPVVERTERVAGSHARAYRQQVAHELLVLGIRDNSADVGLIVELTLEKMPVGQGDEALTGGLAADAILLSHHIVLYKTEHLLPVLWRQEKFLVIIIVVGLDVAHVGTTLQPSAKGIFQPVVNDESRRNDEEMLSEAPARRVLMSGIENLPDEQGMHHPRLAGAGGHLHSIFGYTVFLLREDTAVSQRQQFGYSGLISVKHRLHTHNLV